LISPQILTNVSFALPGLNACEILLGESAAAQKRLTYHKKRLRHLIDETFATGH